MHFLVDQLIKDKNVILDMEAQEIFNKLWAGYVSQNPEAKYIYSSFAAEGEIIKNDHIAFRTFYDTRINVDVIARPFLLAGYIQKGYYIFEDKHLTAKHYEHGSMPGAPRVFISQLMTDHFSPALQSIVKECSAKVSDELAFGNELVFAGNVWGPPSYETYESLRKESEYAAWLFSFLKNDVSKTGVRSVPRFRPRSAAVRPASDG